MQEWFDIKMIAAIPMCANVTLNGLKGCGLRAGDVVRVNGIAYYKIQNLDVAKNMIEAVSCRDGAFHAFSADNVVDLIS